ncbi:tape measure protein [Pedobacter sp.]|uniref:tape measure protein n=1 Tax=Pedobacter sp. TaxID=1411316 RepID=UPI0031D17601
MADIPSNISSLSDRMSRLIILNDILSNQWDRINIGTRALSSAFEGLARSADTLIQRLDRLGSQSGLFSGMSLSYVRAYSNEISQVNTQVRQLSNVDSIGSFESSIQSVRSYSNELSALNIQMNNAQTTAPTEAPPAPAHSTWIRDAMPNIETNPYRVLGNIIGNGMAADKQKGSLLGAVKGDTEKAKSLYEQLSSYSLKSPYDKAELIEVQNTMMKLGLSSETALGKLKNIGDIALGNASNMSTLSDALAKATEKGQLQKEEYQKMKDAGFDPLEAISKKTGESIESLQSRMANGAISAKELSQSFEWATQSGGDFYQGSEKAGQNLGTKWQQMLRGVSEVSLKIHELIAPVLMPIVSGITVVFEKIAQGIGWFIGQLQAGNPYVVAAAIIIGSLAAALLIFNAYTELAAIAQNKLSLAFLKNPVVWVIAAIIALIAAIAYVIYKTDGWGKAWQHTINAGRYIWQAFCAAGQLQWDIMVNGIMIGLNLIKRGWYIFRNSVGLGDRKENNAAIAEINADMRQRAVAVAQGAANVARLTASAGREMRAAAGSLSWNNGRNLSDLTAGFKKQLGISDAPGQPATAKGAGIEGSNTSTGNPIRGTTDGITGGGGRPSIITINLGKMQDQIVINAITAGEGVNSMRQLLEEELNRLLGSVAAMQTT